MAIGGISGPGIPLMSPHIDGGMALPAPSAPEILEPIEPSAFQKLFDNAVGGTNAALLQADEQAAAFASGASDDIHGTMIAVAEADVQLRLLGTMRNKVIDAFYELWRMQI